MFSAPAVQSQALGPVIPWTVLMHHTPRSLGAELRRKLCKSRANGTSLLKTRFVQKVDEIKVLKGKISDFELKCTFGFIFNSEVKSYELMCGKTDCGKHLSVTHTHTPTQRHAHTHTEAHTYTHTYTCMHPFMDAHM